MAQIVLPGILGIADGLLLTLIALGLVLTYGMMRIVNMAHGGFFMLGAFFLATFLRFDWARSPGGYASVIAAAALIPAIIGVGLERTVYQRMYGRPHIAAFLGIFALMLTMQGVTQQIWGNAPLTPLLPTWTFLGSVDVLSARVPTYYLFVIAVALAALIATGLIVYRTKLGLWTRAIAADRNMAAVLGCNIKRIFSVMFGFGCLLAALAGALMTPLTQVDTTLGTTYIIEAFAIVLIGGIGSLRGALVASLAIGIIESYLAIDYPALSGYGIYIAMILVLVIRPQGLFRTANAALGNESV